MGLTRKVAQISLESLKNFAKENLDAARCIAEVDGIRDRWIATDVESWLAEQSFYPGVTDRLKSVLASPIHTVIISTKEKRFIEQLLQKQGVDLTNLRIFGKEVKRPKQQVLRELIQEYGNTESIWFVEDLLKTLQGIATQPDLKTIELFLADWGYNTQASRDSAVQNPRIHLISLSQFSQDFAVWI